MSVGNSKWTPEQRERIAQMWNGGEYTSSQIANEFGTTRNAIIGLAHRMGLSKLSPRKVRLQPPTPQVRSMAQPPKPPQPKPAPKPPEPQPEPVVPAATGWCSYPIGDDPFADDYFCGKPRARGSYCKEHAALCYIKPSRFSSDYVKPDGVPKRMFFRG